jgi:hypothetical protein
MSLLRTVFVVAALGCCWAASASPQLPTDVNRSVERRDACDHFRGEEPYDTKRAAFLNRKQREACAGTDAQLRQLKRKYLRDRAVQSRLAGYEAGIESR